MNKYLFGLCLLVVAGVQFYNAIRIRILSRKRNPENSGIIDKKIKIIDVVGQKIQLMAFSKILIVFIAGALK